MFLRSIKCKKIMIIRALIMTCIYMTYMLVMLNNQEYIQDKNDKALLIIITVGISAVDMYLYCLSDNCKYGYRMMILSFAISIFVIMVNLCYRTNKWFALIMVSILVCSILLSRMAFKVSNVYKLKARNIIELYRKKKQYEKALRSKVYIVSCYSCLLICVLFTLDIFIGRKIKNNDTEQIANKQTMNNMTSDEELFYILNQHDELHVINQREYQNASENELCEATQILADSLCEYLHIQPRKVTFTDFKDEGILGKYSTDTGDIILSKDLITDMKYKVDNHEYLNTLAHEIRHAWEIDVMSYINESDIDLSLPIYDDIRYLKVNFDRGYISSDENSSDSEYASYFTQDMERCANEFGIKMEIKLYYYFNNEQEKTN